MRTNKLETRETHIEGRVNNHFAYTWTEGEKGYFNLVKDLQQVFLYGDIHFACTWAEGKKGVVPFSQRSAVILLYGDVQTSLYGGCNKALWNTTLHEGKCGIEGMKADFFLNNGWLM